MSVEFPLWFRSTGYGGRAEEGKGVETNLGSNDPADGLLRRSNRLVPRALRAVRVILRDRPGGRRRVIADLYRRVGGIVLELSFALLRVAGMLVRVSGRAWGVDVGREGGCEDVLGQRRCL